VTIPARVRSWNVKYTRNVCGKVSGSNVVVTGFLGSVVVVRAGGSVAVVVVVVVAVVVVVVVGAGAVVA